MFPLLTVEERAKIAARYEICGSVVQVDYKGGRWLEIVFHIEGFINRHNCHYWASANPYECVEKTQGRPN
ncbi:hypothetical protein C0J52_17045 [Blattella germanica]|nr:hypothetical protein C0J52_17045 [Blattella germanica]